jgi:hypothetical protein
MIRHRERVSVASQRLTRQNHMIAASGLSLAREKEASSQHNGWHQALHPRSHDPGGHVREWLRWDNSARHLTIIGHALQAAELGFFPFPSGNQLPGLEPRHP